MSAHPVHQSVDLDPPPPARPRLALALALLSVPGVTMAWDVVPGGGFTTGVPLGIAAIVVGKQAHARLNGAEGRRMALSAICIGTIAVLSVALFMVAGAPDSKAQAQTPTGRTITLNELAKGSKFIHVRNTKTRHRTSMALGDLVVFTNPIADASGKLVGKLHADCAATVGNRNFLKGVLTCTAVLTLGDGALMVQTNSSPGTATTAGAIVGGTGAYAGARGVFVSKATARGADDTITLAG
jgi:hypothetical protein